MALALTPSNAVVEQAFSRLTHLLSLLRLRLDPALVQQYMIIALDAPHWSQYDLVLCSRGPKITPPAPLSGTLDQTGAASTNGV